MLIAAPSLFLTLCLCLPVYILLLSYPAPSFPHFSLYVAHFIALFFCQSNCQFLSIPLSIPTFFFHLNSVFLSSATLHSPGTRLSFSTAVTMVFSSIYSEVIIKSGVVTLGFIVCLRSPPLPPTRFSDVISSPPTPIVRQP